LNNQSYPSRHLPQLSIDPRVIATRLRELASAGPCKNCELPVTHAIIDIARLLIQVDRLYIALENERIRSANLEAAMRAALGAYDDGESDPLAYLRDELPDTASGWCP
jgi:hypothetical protein